MKVFNTILELIGKTPLVDISQIVNNKATILAKLEYFNPGASVKDRLALAIIEDAERKNLLKSDSVIIEATSGNTGIGLAMVCAVKKYRLMIVMPENMSIERQKLIKAYGAEVILTPAAEAMPGAVKFAKKLSEELQNSFLTSQFTNSANVEIHERTTALEIWNDTDGKIDIFVSAFGSGGTFTGVSKLLKNKNPKIKTVVPEPVESQLLKGDKACTHKIQGISPGFIPEIFDKTYVDETISVSFEDAKNTANILAKNFGILSGISSGANVFAAIKVAEKSENKNKTIVTIVCDTGERYLSTNLYD
ncbi:MAG: cysteine synthase A [Bacteroidales bacterium]|jgi:cysteine synthase A|nr:cysteine synthase A [Bacteroidales bacterium]HOL97704.1 cysteine synthase A [Bacteroidales bacterium]HOM37431.1 cysteine synthase A [Bacteroidales bacterium]HPD24936.1 cysteine synthase A [Bacteroidales bacterium]HRT00660.1 cysteine synthase A [Bacteroidales bacterium]